MKAGLYSPRVYDEHIRPLYRLARVRGVPMTKIVNALVAEHLKAAADEIARYRPDIHDRRPRCSRCGKVHDRPASDRPACDRTDDAPAAARQAA